MSGPTVFISYSHKDERWKNRLMGHLGVLAKQNLLELWDDRRINAGQDWYQEIQNAMDAARVAILLISAHFLTSDFILREEVQRLLVRKEKEGMSIFPIVVAPCDWEAVPWLCRMQLRPVDGRPLSRGRAHQIDSELASIAKEIRSHLNDPVNPPRSEGECMHVPATSKQSEADVRYSTVVEIIINIDFTSFTERDQQQLLAAIARILETTGDIRVVSKRQGSVRLALELTLDQAERLLKAVRSGELAEFGVTDASIVTDVLDIYHGHERSRTTELVRALKAGDNTAAQTLWDRYFDRLVRLSGRILERSKSSRPIDDAEDIALAAFTEFCLGVRRGLFAVLNESSDIWHLLVLITRRMALDSSWAMRHRGLEPGRDREKRCQIISESDVYQIESQDPSPEFAAMAAEQYQQFLASLPDENLRQTAIWRMEGYTIGEIAERIGCSRRTVARRISIIRIILFKYIDNLDI